MGSKTLVVRYLPSGEESHTQKVLDSFMRGVKGDIEILDLEIHHPPVFDGQSLAAYRARNYGGATLDGKQAESVSPFDALVRQFKAADVIVFAFPMHNFSMPGVVKTYFDAVMLHGETFKYGEHGPAGLMGAKKALVIAASGGFYPSGSPMNNIDTLAKIELGFMGFGAQEYIYAGGQLGKPEVAMQQLAQAEEEARKLASSWYLN